MFSEEPVPPERVLPNRIHCLQSNGRTDCVTSHRSTHPPVWSKSTSRKNHQNTSTSFTPSKVSLSPTLNLTLQKSNPLIVTVCPALAFMPLSTAPIHVQRDQKCAFVHVSSRQKYAKLLCLKPACLHQIYQCVIGSLCDCGEKLLKRILIPKFVVWENVQNGKQVLVLA